MSRASRAVLAVTLWLGVLGCVTQSPPDPTDAPALHEVAGSDLRNRMQGLARSVEELQLIMWRDTPLEPEDHERLRRLLKQMSDTALSLDVERDSHPDLAQSLPELQRDLSWALAGSLAVPPNYYFAGEVAAACTYCHEPRHNRGPIH